MNLNALDNLLYKKKNVLAHPLRPDIQHLQKRKNWRIKATEVLMLRILVFKCKYGKPHSYFILDKYSVAFVFKKSDFFPLEKWTRPVCKVSCHLVSFMTN